MEYCVRDVRTVSPSQLRQWFDCLSPAQQAKILQLRRTEGQVSRLCAYRLALEMLSGCTGLAMDELDIRADELGKPHVCNAAVHFNISHSGNFVACAVDSRPVGIDLEEVRPVRDALIRRVCHADELPLACASSEGFFRIWTAKEALLKYRGTGIREDLRGVRVVRDGKLCAPPLQMISQTTDEYVLCIVHE